MAEKEQSKNTATTYNEFYSKTDWKENQLYTRLYIKSLMILVSRIFKSQINTVIDIGCGTGVYTYTFSKDGFKAVGVDYSDVAINKAKVKFPGCNFEWQDASNLNLSQKFDMFFVKGFSLFNTTDFQKAQEIIRSWSEWLSDDGIIVIQSRTNFSQQSPSNWYFHTEAEIQKMFNISAYKFSLAFIYNKLQYVFLIPFMGKRMLKIVNWISKKVIIGWMKKPVNYFVFLTKNDLNL